MNRLGYNMGEGCEIASCVKDSVASSTVPTFVQPNRTGGNSMKEIPLTLGQVAVVDDTDFKWLNQCKWSAYKHYNTFYARRSVWDGERHLNIKMHREILGLKRGDGKLTDHIDRNGLNNQRSNLRICTPTENSRNRTNKKNTSSKYKGVSWRAKSKMWYVQIDYNKQRRYLGSFADEIEAAKVYDAKAKKLFGEFAYLNFPKKEDK